MVWILPPRTTVPKPDRGVGMGAPALHVPATGSKISTAGMIERPPIEYSLAPTRWPDPSERATEAGGPKTHVLA